MHTIVKEHPSAYDYGRVAVTVEYRYRGEWRRKTVALAEVAQWVRNGRYARRVDAVRDGQPIQTAAGLGGGSMAEAGLPLVLPGTGSDGSCTGLALLTIAAPGGHAQLERLRSRACLWDAAAMVMASADGRSLVVLMAYRLTGGGLPAGTAETALFRQYACRRAADFATAVTGLVPEAHAADGTEGFRISHDPEVWLNDDVRPVLIDQPTAPLDGPADLTAPVPARQAGTDALAEDVLPGYTRREMEVTTYNMVCRQLAYSPRREAPEHLLRLAVECRRAGIDRELATKLTIYLGDYVGQDTLVRSTFENAYCRHRMGTALPMDRSLMHQQLLQAFLRRRYCFRRNAVTGEVEYQEKDRYETGWRTLSRRARNDINNAAIDEGIKVWPQDIDRVVDSRLTEDYDPVGAWLDALPRWDGRDRIGELAARVPVRSEGWTEDFRVWMRSMVRQWRSGCGALHGAQVMLMMVGAQGTRKSTFMRMLLPPELRQYYTDRIDFTNKKDALRAIGRFLLINLDEYDQVSKAQTAFLKHLVQRTDIKERTPYTTVIDQQPRRAAFCATTNSLTPLRDESGGRRYLVAELAGVIDTAADGDRAIDYRQLYAQVVEELQAGLESAFTGERERAIIDRSADYYETPSVVQLFLDRFHKPAAVSLLTEAAVGLVPDGEPSGTGASGATVADGEPSGTGASGAMVPDGEPSGTGAPRAMVADGEPSGTGATAAPETPAPSLLALSPTEILQLIRSHTKLNVVTQSNATIIGTYLRRHGFPKTGRRYVVESQVESRLIRGTDT